MKTDSILINLPKNMVQYFIGFALYLLVYGSFDPLKLILGLASFLIAYSAIYPYNDLMDYEQDKKDEFKKVYKALVRGDLKQKDAISLVFGLSIIGLMLASLVSQWYMFLISITLFQNFLHSNPHTKNTFKKKKRYMVPNIFIMQFIKYSLGWFTFTTDLTKLPTWVITTFSLGYVYAYILYKSNIKDMLSVLKKKIKIMLPLTIIIIFTYSVSFWVYPFKIPLLLVIPLLLLIFTMSKQKNVVTKTFKLSNITLIILGGTTIMLLLLNIPVISEINDNVTEIYNKIGNLTLETMGNNTYELIYTINETVYTYPIRDLKELNKLFNLTSTEVIVNENCNLTE